jgi:hypothetical protein
MDVLQESNYKPWKRRYFGPGPERVTNVFLNGLFDRIARTGQALSGWRPGVVIGCKPDFSGPDVFSFTAGSLVSNGRYFTFAEPDAADYTDPDEYAAAMAVALAARTVHVEGAGEGDPVWFYIDGEGHLTYTVGVPPGWPDHVDQPTDVENHYCVIGWATYSSDHWHEGRDIRRFARSEPVPEAWVVGHPGGGADFTDLQQALDWLEACDLAGAKVSRTIVLTEDVAVSKQIVVRVPGVTLRGGQDYKHVNISIDNVNVMLKWLFVPGDIQELGPQEYTRQSAVIDLGGFTDITLEGIIFRRTGGLAGCAIWDPGSNFTMRRCKVICDYGAGIELGYVVALPYDEIRARMRFSDNVFENLGIDSGGIVIGGLIMHLGIWIDPDPTTLDDWDYMGSSSGCLVLSVIERNRIRIKEGSTIPAAEALATSSIIEIGAPAIDCGVNDERAVFNQVDQNVVEGGTMSIRVGRYSHVRNNILHGVQLFGVWVASSGNTPSNEAQVVDAGTVITGNSILFHKDNVFPWWRAGIYLQMSHCAITDNNILTNGNPGYGVLEGNMYNVPETGGSIKAALPLEPQEPSIGYIHVYPNVRTDTIDVGTEDEFTVSLPGGVTVIYKPDRSYTWTPPVLPGDPDHLIITVHSYDTTGVNAYVQPGHNFGNDYVPVDRNISHAVVADPGITGTNDQWVHNREAGPTQLVRGTVYVTTPATPPASVDSELIELSTQSRFTRTIYRNGQAQTSVLHPCQNYAIDYDKTDYPIIVESFDPGPLGRMDPLQDFEPEELPLELQEAEATAKAGLFGINGSSRRQLEILPGEYPSLTVEVHEIIDGGGVGQGLRIDPATDYCEFVVGVKPTEPSAIILAPATPVSSLAAGQPRILARFKPTQPYYMPEAPEVGIPRGMNIEMAFYGMAIEDGDVVDTDASYSSQIAGNVATHSFYVENKSVNEDDYPPITGIGGTTGALKRFTNPLSGCHLVRGNQILFDEIEEDGPSKSDAPKPPIDGFGILLLSRGNRISANEISRAATGIFVSSESVVEENQIRTTCLGISVWRRCAVRANQIWWYRVPWGDDSDGDAVDDLNIPINPLFQNIPIYSGILASVENTITANEIFGIPSGEYTIRIDIPPIFVDEGDLSGIIGGDLSGITPELVINGLLSYLKGTPKADDPDIREYLAYVMPAVLIFDIPLMMVVIELARIIWDWLNQAQSPEEAEGAAEDDAASILDQVMQPLKYLIGAFSLSEVVETEVLEPAWWWPLVNWGGNTVNDNKIDIRNITIDIEVMYNSDTYAAVLQPNMGILSSSGLLSPAPTRASEMRLSNLGSNTFASDTVRGGLASFLTISPDIVSGCRFEETALLGLAAIGLYGPRVEGCHISGDGISGSVEGTELPDRWYVALILAPWLKSSFVGDSILEGKEPCVGIVGGDGPIISSCTIRATNPNGGRGLIWYGNFGVCSDCHFWTMSEDAQWNPAQFTDPRSPGNNPRFPAIKFAVGSGHSVMPITKGNLVVGAHLSGSRARFCVGSVDPDSWIGEPGLSPIEGYGQNPHPPTRVVVGGALQWTNRVCWDTFQFVHRRVDET